MLSLSLGLVTLPNLKDDLRFIFALLGENWWKLFDDLEDGEGSRWELLNDCWLFSRFCHVPKFSVLILLNGLSMVLFERFLMNWFLLEEEDLSVFSQLKALIEAITAWTFPEAALVSSSLTFNPCCCWFDLFIEGSLPRRT